MTRICPNCQQETSDAEAMCASCGYSLENSQVASKENRVVKIFKKTKKFVVAHKVLSIIIAVVVLFCAVGLPIIFSPNLTGSDLATYKLVLKGANEFKDPSSVRVVSGYINDKGDSGWFIISAKNSYGARVTNPYFFCDDKELGFFILKDDEANSFHKKIDSFNIDKVNSALDKKWKNIT